MKKKGLLITISSIGFFLVMIASATFAYFAASINVESNMNINTKTPNLYSFAINASKDINLDVSEVDMLQGVSANDKIVAEDDGFLDIMLYSSSDSDKVTCNFDIVFRYTSEDKYMVADAELGEGIYEFSLRSNHFSERDLSSLDWYVDEETGLYEAVVASDTIESSLAAGESKKFGITATIYNNEFPQDSLSDSNFTGYITADNIDCTVDTIRN